MSILLLSLLSLLDFYHKCCFCVYHGEGFSFCSVLVKTYLVSKMGEWIAQTKGKNLYVDVQSTLVILVLSCGHF